MPATLTLIAGDQRVTTTLTTTLTGDECLVPSEGMKFARVINLRTIT